MTISYQRISQITPVILALKNQGLTPISVIKLLKLGKILREVYTEREQAVNIILENYEVKREKIKGARGYVVNIEGHEKEKEIKDAMSIIDQQQANIAPLNFMSEEELVKASFGLDTKTLLALYDLLVDENKPTIPEETPKERERPRITQPLN